MKSGAATQGEGRLPVYLVMKGKKKRKRQRKKKMKEKKQGSERERRVGVGLYLILMIKPYCSFQQVLFRCLSAWDSSLF